MNTVKCGSLYYLINHTHQQYCFLDVGISIFRELESAIRIYKWSHLDDIRIESENECNYNSVCLYYGDLGYKLISEYNVE